MLEIPFTLTNTGHQHNVLQVDHLVLLLLLHEGLEVDHGVQLLRGVAQQGLEVTHEPVHVPGKYHV